VNIPGPAAFLGALDLLNGPDGEVLQSGLVLEGLRLLLQLPGLVAGLGKEDDRPQLEARIATYDPPLELRAVKSTAICLEISRQYTVGA